MVGNAHLTRDDWDHHRENITELWSRMTLKKLRHHMQANHGFSASERMYEEHFKKWGLHKYSKRAKKHEMLEIVLRDTQTQSILPDLDMNKDDLRNVLGYLQDMQRTDAIDPGTFCSSTTATGDSPTTSSSIQALTPESIGCDSLNDGEQSATGTSNHQILLALVGSKRAYVPCPPLHRMPDHASSESQNLEAILRSVSSCFAVPDFGHENQCTASAQVRPMNLGSQALFWDELKHGIYLLKIAAFERAFPVLHKTVELASGAFAESPMAFVLELFSTLSPVNTTVCPDVRLSLLRGFVVLAGQRFGTTHSITVICSELQKDRTSQEISERGLSFMIDLLTSTRGMSYILTFRAQLALIRLLRRSKDYGRAGVMARRFASRSIGLFGVLSVYARMASRELEHVLMDQNEWQQALEVCFSIVGQPSFASEMIEPQYHDEYAVHTMEDIAKIYENLGQPESCTAWLVRAAKSAYISLGPCTATTHIIDKLVAALVASGRHDDAKFWQNVHMASGDGVV